MSRYENDLQPYLNDGHNPEHTRSICIESAVSIAKLLQLYQKRYGLRHINIQAVGITCSAALLLIFAIVVGDKGSVASNPTRSSMADPAMYLGTCFNALEEFSGAWESAKKVRDFLHLLQRRWEIQARKLRKNRVRPREGGNMEIPTKRQRTTSDGSEGAPTHSMWPDAQLGDGNVLGAMDLSTNLDWILMVNSSSPTTT